MHTNQSSICRVSRTSLDQPCWTGGRGKRGPLLTWMAEHDAEITAARASEPPRSWRDIASDVEGAGVVSRDGSPYTIDDLRTTWFRLASQRARSRSTVAPRNVSPPGALEQGHTSAAQARPEHISTEKIRVFRWITKKLVGRGTAAAAAQRSIPSSQGLAELPIVPAKPVSSNIAASLPPTSADSMPPVRRFGEEL